VGVSGGDVLLDLNYEEDSRAEADMNIVMSGAGHFVEIQATGEKRPFTESEFLSALGLAKKGISRIIQKQKEIIDGYSSRNK
jgi:ribonuclease PH